MNAMRHGLCGAGKLPPKLRNVARAVSQYRRALEDALLSEHGGIDARQAGLVATAARWERYSLLAARWLTENDGELNPEDKLRFAGEAARASSARDGAVAKLGLPGGGPDPYARVMAEEDG
mgnify:FL=1